MTVSALVTALLDVPKVIGELDAATPRLTLTASYGERTSSGSKTAPVPLNLAAVDAKSEILSWLTAAALTLGEPLAGVKREPAPLARHLLANMEAIDANGWHDEWAGLLTELLDEARNILEPRTARQQLGPCPTVGCLTPLTAPEHAHEARCLTCGQTCNVTDFRVRRAMEALGHDGTPLRAAQAVRFLNGHGIRVTTKDVENWLRWGHITETSTDDKGRRQYNLRDIYTQATRKAS